MDWECGGRDAATAQRLIERLKRWRARLYCADDYAVYEVLLPVGRLYAGKDETHGIYGEDNRMEYYSRILDFLALHIGGRRAGAASTGTTAGH